MQEDHIRFYCGLSHKYWNHHLCQPGPYACISPVISYSSKRGLTTNGVYVPTGTYVLQDSGAYSDVRSNRLSFADALKRQDEHSLRYDYTQSILYRASYDLLIDHKMLYDSKQSRRKIQRVSEADGIEAVHTTVRAARFLNNHRNGYSLALNAQGVTPRQYLDCVEQIVPLVRAEDLLGLGGWCILGRLPSMMSDFLQTLALVIPFLAREGIPRVHLYGSLYTPAIAACLAICDYCGISLSLDSAYPSFAPLMGQWGYGSWRIKCQHYMRPEVLASCHDQSCPPGTYCRGLQRIEHVKSTREWLASFRDRESVLYNRYRSHIDQYVRGRIYERNFCPSWEHKHDRPSENSE